MKHTRDFKSKGFKGNSRGNSIQAPFTTLEEMFKQLPETIGFNIEMSMRQAKELHGKAGELTCARISHAS